MKRIFKAEINPKTNLLGWHLASVPKFDARQGEGVAHDTMEHRPHTDIRIEEELIAFGTSLVTRNDTPEQFGQLLAHDFYPLLESARWLDQPLRRNGWPQHFDSRIETMIAPLWDSPLAPWTVRNVGRWIEHGYELGKRRYANKPNVQQEFIYLWTLADLYLGDAEPGDRLIVAPHDNGSRHVTVVFERTV